VTLTTHEQYFSSLTESARERLESVRGIVEHEVPDAVRCISYQLPAFRLPPARGGRVFCYIAHFKQHVGIYPPVEADADLIAELAPYRGPKGNLSFPHAAPLPLPLIGRVARALAAQYA
jgi:uncharacterized protein YdhG (YjbR/CyaY superfamily)